MADQRKGGAPAPPDQNFMQFFDKCGKFCMLAPTSYGESCICPWFSTKRRGVGWTPAYCLPFFSWKKRMKMNFGPEWERGVGIPDLPITLGLERGMARVEARLLRLKFARVQLRAPKAHLSISNLGHNQCVFITRCGSILDLRFWAPLKFSISGPCSIFLYFFCHASLGILFL